MEFESRGRFPAWWARAPAQGGRWEHSRPLEAGAQTGRGSIVSILCRSEDEVQWAQGNRESSRSLGARCRRHLREAVSSNAIKDKGFTEYEIDYPETMSAKRRTEWEWTKRYAYVQCRNAWQKAKARSEAETVTESEFVAELEAMCPDL